MKKIYILSDEEHLVTHDHYESAVRAAGGDPYLVRLEDDPAVTADADGILIPGGVDINPARYGEENRGSLGICDALDSFQLRAFDLAVKRKIPVLGICRGIQLLNVYFGGTLIQDLADSELHAKNSIKEDDKVHLVTAAAGSWPAEIYGKTEFYVNSSHHQAVDRLGEGLRIVMRSEAGQAAGDCGAVIVTGPVTSAEPGSVSPDTVRGDGVVEGVVHESLPIIATQWHPERMSLTYRRSDTEDGMPVFRKFLSMI